MEHSSGQCRQERPEEQHLRSYLPGRSGVRYSRVLRHRRVHRPSFCDRADARRRSDPHDRPHPGQHVYPANSAPLLHGGRLFRRGEPERPEDPPGHSRVWPHILDHALEGSIPGFLHR